MASLQSFFLKRAAPNANFLCSGTPWQTELCFGRTRSRSSGHDARASCAYVSFHPRRGSKGIKVRVMKNVSNLRKRVRRRLSLFWRQRSFETSRLRWIVDHFERQLGGARAAKLGIPIDGDGQPIPWYTYPAIEFLNQLDFSNSSIFEYGSGNSSKWWASRCKKLVSVESDKSWFEYLQSTKPDNQELILRSDPKEYIFEIKNRTCELDVIVIDGSIGATVL
jgi:hypothetical protein